MIAIVSFLVACALEQPVTRLERRGIRRGVATMVVLLLIILMLVVTSVAGGTLLVTQISSLTEALPDLARSFVNFANTFGLHLTADVPADAFGARVEAILRDNAANLLVQGSLVIGQIAAGALLVFYFVADGPRLRRNVCSLFPASRQQTILEIWTAAIDKAGGYLVVRAALALAASISSWLFFTLAGVDYAIALALWVGLVSQIVPAVGTYLAALLPLLVAAGDGTTEVVATLLFLVTYQQVENYILAPRIARKVMEVHPAIGFFAAICGVVVAGAPGALIAVPIVATAQAVISASLERHQLVENELLAHTSAKTRRTRRTLRHSATPSKQTPRKQTSGGESTRKQAPASLPASTKKSAADKSIAKKPNRKSTKLDATAIPTSGKISGGSSKVEGARTNSKSGSKASKDVRK